MGKRENRTTTLHCRASETKRRTEKQKQVNALNKIEHKLLKHEKQKHQNALSKISVVKTKLFPKNVLQERHDNFIPFYLKYGVDFFDFLKKELKPFEHSFTLIIDQ